jgi:type IV fimbrial biogenesis protein FimT
LFCYRTIEFFVTINIGSLLSNGLIYMRKINGFTLMEMMTVIAIMAILAVVAIPSFISYVPGMKLRSASRDLYTTLQNTRTKAIRQNTRWALQFNGSASNVSSYRMIDCGQNNVCGDNDDANIGPINSVAPGIAISHNFSGNMVSFTSEGTCDSGTVFIKKIKTPFVCKDDQTCAIVNPAGGMKLVPGNHLLNSVNECPCN